MNQLTLRVKFLSEFSPQWWDEQSQGARDLLGAVGINVTIQTPERHAFGDGDGVISVGLCTDALEQEQQDLFASISGVPPTDVVIFIVNEISPSGFAGCAKHPPGQPGLVIAQATAGSPKWVLAHELGHVLGLDHCPDSFRLMYGSVWWTGDPPALLDWEQAQALASPVLS